MLIEAKPSVDHRFGE